MRQPTAFVRRRKLGTLIRDDGWSTAPQLWRFHEHNAMNGEDHNRAFSRRQQGSGPHDRRNHAAICPFPANGYCCFGRRPILTRRNRPRSGSMRGMLASDRSPVLRGLGGQPSDHGTLATTSGLTAAITDLRYLDAAKTRIGFALPEGNAEAWWQCHADTRLCAPPQADADAFGPGSAVGRAALCRNRWFGGNRGWPLIPHIPDAGLDKDDITERLNALIARNATIRARSITEAELDANPQLVKTMSVKPPRGTGTIRLIEIEGLDLQPCGGTHVGKTGEIGRVVVTNIEKKGKVNCRSHWIRAHAR